MGSDPARAIDLLRDATRLVVLSGAGASTESGVPDFRGSGGTRSRSEADAPEGASSIWEKFDPSDFEFSRFQRDPKGFWELRARLMDALALHEAKPNPAHEALAQASRSPRYRGHVTQNIDGLFHEAGHDEEKIVEIHGSARKTRCIGCMRFFPYEAPVELLDGSADPSAPRRVAPAVPPRCPACGGALKPGTILFGEPLHEPDLRRAQRWMEEADAVLVVGSSLVVHPVGALPELALSRGARLVIVNRSTTPYDEDADIVVREPAGGVLPSILAASGLI